MGIENKPNHSGQIRILDEYQMCLNNLVLLLCLVTKQLLGEWLFAQVKNIKHRSYLCTRATNRSKLICTLLKASLIIHSSELENLHHFQNHLLNSELLQWAVQRALPGSFKPGLYSRPVLSCMERTVQSPYLLVSATSGARLVIIIILETTVLAAYLQISQTSTLCFIKHNTIWRQKLSEVYSVQGRHGPSTPFWRDILSSLIQLHLLSEALLALAINIRTTHPYFHKLSMVPKGLCPQ